MGENAVTNNEILKKLHDVQTQLLLLLVYSFAFSPFHSNHPFYSPALLWLTYSLSHTHPCSSPFLFHTLCLYLSIILPFSVHTHFLISISFHSFSHHISFFSYSYIRLFLYLFCFPSVLAFFIFFFLHITDKILIPIHSHDWYFFQSVNLFIIHNKTFLSLLFIFFIIIL